MYNQGYQTPVFIPNLYDWVKKTSILVKFFHFQGTNVHLGLPNSSFYPHRVKKTSFLVKFFHFQGTNVHLGVPNSSLYPQFVRSGQKNFLFSEIFPFLGNKCTFGGTKLQFLSQSGEKNLIFSEMFPFLGNKCTFGGTKLQFLSPICTIGSKTSFLVKFFHFQETNVHLGVPNSIFYPNRVQKNFIFSEMFPFLGNNCSFGGTKLQFLSQSGQKNLIFSEIFPFLGNKGTFGGTKLQILSPLSQKDFIFSEIFPVLGNKCTFGGTKLQVLSPICTIRSKKTSFLVKFFHFQGTNIHLGLPNTSSYPKRVKKNLIFSEIFPFLGNKFTFGGTKLQFLSPICTIG